MIPTSAADKTTSTSIAAIAVEYKILVIRWSDLHPRSLDPGRGEPFRRYGMELQSFKERACESGIFIRSYRNFALA